ncbi:unnamed protein product [Spirodela intermedia]|uniref:Uncharacterized protein n=1 Tax=Spirodela intermedia TaxID=51605 RepID=A0A7I8J2S6_SPIIN|nr:unnamed protein product [Spirodela intermedia]CAA6664438.1 unnamed protein product [Spirodela intermedia]
MRCLRALVFFFSSSPTKPHVHRHSAAVPRIKAVNLGGWLVTEGWIKPSLFDGIANKDLLDGTQVQLKSTAVGKYLCAEGGGGSVIVANRSSASGWETFKLWRVNSTHFQFRVFSKQFVGINAGGSAVTVATTPGHSETFEIVKNTGDSNRIRIRAPNDLFLQANWGNDDPSVFLMTTFGTMQGEYQVTNGYGPIRAPAVMRNHWESFIVEKDFKFMKDNGLNAVRVPVGWWIASDPNPPAPYVGGSLAALDNAFMWAEKYHLKVIIDLHAALGSQNGDEHSGGRDGSIEWGVAGSGNVEKTVTVIEFLTRRYAARRSLIAVELINEPRAEGVDFDTLKSYYQAGYDAVRRHTSTAYVIFSARLSADAGEFIPFARGLDGTVLDVHYYNLFSSIFDGWTAQKNIDYVNNQRASQLAAVTNPNGGPLSFVGEWVAEWNVNGATADDYRRFGEAQLNVFGRASFGWAYWTYKHVNNHWSLQWMITNGVISLK